MQVGVGVVGEGESRCPPTKVVHAAVFVFNFVFVLLFVFVFNFVFEFVIFYFSSVSSLLIEV